MSTPTDLTNRIAHLRNREGDTPIISQPPLPDQPQKHNNEKSSERKFAVDSFMLFVYGLLGVALIAQIILIFWLDVI
ncbi:MAG: hypothetical protein ACSHYA_14180 [Opitutaceae bacterium]